MDVDRQTGSRQRPREIIGQFRKIIWPAVCRVGVMIMTEIITFQLRGIEKRKRRREAFSGSAFIKRGYHHHLLYLASFYLAL